MLTYNGRLLQMIDYTASTSKAYIYVLDVHGNVVALVNDTGNRILNSLGAWGINEAQNYAYDKFGIK